MSNEHHIRWNRLLITFAIFLAGVYLSSALAGQSNEKSKEQSVEKREFELTIQEGLISLSAKEASVSAIVEEIGRQMSIDVDAYIPGEEKITVEIDKVSLEAAIKRLSERFVYVTDSSKDDNKITKIYLLPKGEQAVLSSKESVDEQPPQPEPFELFRYDP